MFFTAGTETYGRVKSVRGTPIVTKFAMFQLMPLWPLQSFYRTGKGKSTSTGIPLFASTRTEAILGLPLSRIDKTSAMIAYVRAICAIFAVFGFIPLVAALVSANGRNVSEITLAATIVFLTGTIVGSLTYGLPLLTSREREIRQHCGQLLGFYIDPARMRSEFSAQITDYLNRTREPDENRCLALLRTLVKTRAMISQTADKHRLELTTDELLEQLRHTDI